MKICVNKYKNNNDKYNCNVQGENTLEIIKIK